MIQLITHACILAPPLQHLTTIHVLTHQNLKFANTQFLLNAFATSHLVLLPALNQPESSWLDPEGKIGFPLVHSATMFEIHGMSVDSSASKISSPCFRQCALFSQN